MSFLRVIGRRAYQPPAFTSISSRTFTSHVSLRAEGYGDPKGDPAGANPQEQGRNPEVGKEHPGPAPPSAAGGEGGSSKSSPSSSSQSKDGAKPAIHSESQPKNDSEDVKRHNEEFEQRKEKSHSKSDDEKVDPKFWKGEGGKVEQ